MPDDIIPGKTLRRERRLEEISVTALAAAMGTTRQTIWVLEKSADATERAAEYRAALEVLKASPSRHGEPETVA